MSSGAVRIGHGYDLHRLEPCAPRGAGRPFVLGGIAIEHDRGPVAHSDGDALLHAATDAVLGAIGAPDLGTLYPDTDPRWRDADSSRFLRDAVARLHAAGYRIGNLDATVICERPKIAPHRAALRAALARLLECEPGRVNVKGKTHEGLDAVGEGHAIEVHVVAVVERAGDQ